MDSNSQLPGGQPCNLSMDCQWPATGTFISFPPLWIRMTSRTKAAAEYVSHKPSEHFCQKGLYRLQMEKLFVSLSDQGKARRLESHH